MPGPLEGIRVIDLTTIYSGPMCTSILGDQGADIIKVESPDGDFMRVTGLRERNGVTAPFAMLNRNKRSVAIDLSTDEGRSAFGRLVSTADVVVENYRPGVMERLGIGYESLKEINEKLIFASINGVGHAGPLSHRRVYDAIVQSLSGIGSLQANPRTDHPRLINTLICDKVTAMTAAQAISSALIARGRTGVGQRVDISMLDSALFFMWPDNMQSFTFVGDDEPYEYQESHAAMVRETSDGYICAMPVQVEEWHGLYRALDLPILTEDEWYLTEDGVVNIERVFETIGEAFAKFTTAEVSRRLEEQHVPFSHINARDEVIDDPQVKAAESILEFDHPFAGPMRQARPPGRFSETPAGIFRCSPEHGEHTRDVLEEVGYTSEEVTEMRKRNVVR